MKEPWPKYRGSHELRTTTLILDQVMPDVEAIEDLIQDNYGLFERHIYAAGGQKIRAARLFLEEVIAQCNAKAAAHSDSA